MMSNEIVSELSIEGLIATARSSARAFQITQVTPEHKIKVQAFIESLEKILLELLIKDTPMFFSLENSSHRALFDAFGNLSVAFVKTMLQKSSDDISSMDQFLYSIQTLEPSI